MSANRLSPEQARTAMDKLAAEWTLNDVADCISREYHFSDYHHTMAFVNAVAWIAMRHHHHPDLLVSYNRCQVNYSTHSASGLTEMDFRCAKEIDEL